MFHSSWKNKVLLLAAAALAGTGAADTMSNHQFASGSTGANATVSDIETMLNAVRENQSPQPPKAVSLLEKAMRQLAPENSEHEYAVETPALAELTHVLAELDGEAVEETPLPTVEPAPVFATLNGEWRLDQTGNGAASIATHKTEIPIGRAEPPSSRADSLNRKYYQIGAPAPSSVTPGSGVVVAQAAKPSAPRIVSSAGMQTTAQQAESGDPLDQLVVLEFQEMELSAVVQLLAQMAQINVIAGTEVQGVVSANLRNIPLRQGIETVLRIQGLGMIEEEGIYRIVPYEEAVAARRKQRLAYLEYAQANEVRDTMEDVIATSPDAAYLSVASNASTNVIIISGPEDAVDELYDLAIKLDVADPALPTVTRALKLNYAEPRDVLPILQSLSSQEIGAVSIDERGRHVVVTDIPIVVEEMEKLVHSIDLPVKQVSIDAMIVDALMSDNAETGIDWILSSIRRTNRRGEVVGDLQSASLETDITGGTTTPGALSQIPQAASLAFQVLSGDINLRAVLAAEVMNGDAELLANPVVVTVENQPARISIAEEIPFQELTQTTTGPPISTTEFKEVGTVLEVIPRVTHDNHIIVNLSAKQSDTKGESVTGVPPEDKREAETTLSVRDGQTIFIGGLRRIDDEKTIRKVPIAGDIPVLSFLFRRSLVVNEIVELLIFLTCNVLGEDIPDLTPYQQDRFDTMGGKPLVPRAQREMLRDFVHTDELRDPFWKWRRTK